MEIYYDLRSFNPNKGNSRYAFMVIGGLCQARPDSRIYVIVSEKNIGYFRPLALNQNVRFVLRSAVGTAFLLLYRRFINGTGGIFHQLGGWFGLVPLLLGFEVVITVHDLNFSNFRLGVFRKAIRSSIFVINILCASRVIYISNFSRSEVCKFFPSLYLRSLRKSDIIYNGYSRFPFDFKSSIASDSYWLCFNHQTHKRADISCKALTEFNRRTGRNDSLVVVGSSGVDGVHFGDEGLNVVVKSGISDVELFKLYKCARGLLFPSEYEGFGFPLLEAMDAGIPVVAYSVAATPEICGSAALLVNENSASLIASCMVQLESVPLLRENMVRSGKVNLDRFSWNRCIESILVVYQKTRV